MNPYNKQNPFMQQNPMAGHSGMPTPQEYNPYAQYFRSPYGPVDQHNYTPGFWEAMNWITPRNIAIDPMRREAYRNEYNRRYWMDLRHSFYGASADVGKTAFKWGGMAVGMGLSGKFAAGALGIGAATGGVGLAVGLGATALVSGLGYLGIDQLAQRGVESVAFETFRRYAAGPRGARLLGLHGRDLYDTALPDNLKGDFRKISSDLGIALKDVYEFGVSGIREGTLSADSGKKFSERLRELIDGAIKVARDIGGTLGDANKFASDLSARGFSNPMAAAKNMAGNLRKIVDQTGLDPRFVQQMSNVGYQIGMNYRANPLVSANMMSNMSAAAMMAKETPFLGNANESFAVLGGPEAVASMITQRTHAGIFEAGPSVMRAILMQQKEGGKFDVRSLSNYMAKERATGFSMKSAREMSKNFETLMIFAMASQEGGIGGEEARRLLYLSGLATNEDEATVVSNTLFQRAIRQSDDVGKFIKFFNATRGKVDDKYKSVVNYMNALNISDVDRIRIAATHRYNMATSDDAKLKIKEALETNMNRMGASGLSLMDETEFQHATGVKENFFLKWRDKVGKKNILHDSKVLQNLMNEKDPVSKEDLNTLFELGTTRMGMTTRGLYFWDEYKKDSEKFLSGENKSNLFTFTTNYTGENKRAHNLFKSLEARGLSEKQIEELLRRDVAVAGKSLSESEQAAKEEKKKIGETTLDNVTLDQLAERLSEVAASSSRPSGGVYTDHLGGRSGDRFSG